MFRYHPLKHRIWSRQIMPLLWRKNIRIKFKSFYFLIIPSIAEIDKERSFCSIPRAITFFQDEVRLISMIWVTKFIRLFLGAFLLNSAPAEYFQYTNFACCDRRLVWWTLKDSTYWWYANFFRPTREADQLCQTWAGFQTEILNLLEFQVVLEV